jgi:hypothetical protein
VKGFARENGENGPVDRAQEYKKIAMSAKLTTQNGVYFTVRYDQKHAECS